MTDTEKKIAEIRKSAEEARKTKGSWVDGQDYADDVEFLLNELEQLEREYAEERAAHNAHVTELCELEKENRKLREEREKWEKEARLQYRLFNEYHDESREKIEQLRAERAKLIEGLRWYADEQNYDGSEFRLSETEKDMGQRARNILREIGVTVE